MSFNVEPAMRRLLNTNFETVSAVDPKDKTTVNLTYFSAFDPKNKFITVRHLNTDNKHCISNRNWIKTNENLITVCVNNGKIVIGMHEKFEPVFQNIRNFKIFSLNKTFNSMKTIFYKKNAYRGLQAMFNNFFSVVKKKENKETPMLKTHL